MLRAPATLLWLLLQLQTLVRLAGAHCEVGSVNFVRSSNVRPLDSLLRQLTDRQQISSLRCHQSCIDRPECTGYLYDRGQSHCYLLDGDGPRINHQNLIRSPDWSYHRRICLTTGEFSVSQPNKGCHHDGRRHDS